jgi:hypothetical protein
MTYYLPGVRFRPIVTWPGVPTPPGERRWSPFRASWDDTLALLDRELRMLGAREVVCQIDIRESDFRQDGQPRANAKAHGPGVILAFDSRYGPLQYATDVFHDWRENVRATALALEALRKVDRYGVTKRGEQYTGWKMLPAPSSGMTLEEARAVIAQAVADHGSVRAALAAAHPDRTGGDAQFKRLTQARSIADREGRS